jgi:hypothetical protein
MPRRYLTDLIWRAKDWCDDHSHWLEAILAMALICLAAFIGTGAALLVFQ